MVRKFILRALATIPIVMVSSGAIAAGPPSTRPGAATKPATWHGQIAPWVIPAEDQEAADAMLDDPAYAWLATQQGTVETREGAFRILISTRIFTYEIVGAGASRSQHSRALEVLLKQPDARAVFLDLLERGNDVGKLYGLCGLYELDDPAVFAERIAPYQQSKTEISSQWGCVIHTSKVATVAAGIATGETSYRLLHPYSKTSRPARSEKGSISNR